MATQLAYRWKAGLRISQRKGCGFRGRVFLAWMPDPRASAYDTKRVLEGEIDTQPGSGSNSVNLVEKSRLARAACLGTQFEKSKASDASIQ